MSRDGWIVYGAIGPVATLLWFVIYVGLARLSGRHGDG